jgi:hypothetical protein
MSNFVTEKAITPQSLLGKFQGFIDFSEDKLDVLAAFLDITTNYYEHTGTQTRTHTQTRPCAHLPAHNTHKQTSA